MGPRKIKPEGRQGIVESRSWIKYRITDDELREALGITSPGMIVTISHDGSRGWVVTQSTT